MSSLMKSRFDAALRVVAGAMPAIVAAAGASTAAPAAHDDGVVRTTGAGFTGAFHALDLLVAAPTLLLPIGTRCLRAGLASAAVTGICGVLAYDLARMLVLMVVPSALHRVGLGPKPRAAASTRLYSAVALVGVLTALLSPAWQAEASAPGGAVTGALLVLLSLHVPFVGLRDGLLQQFPSEEDALASRLPISMLIVGLAASYDVLTLAACIPGVVPLLVSYVGHLSIARKNKEILAAAKKKKEPPDASSSPPTSSAWPIHLHAAMAFLLGLGPLLLGVVLVHRAPELSLSGSSMFALFPPSATKPIALMAFASSEIGTTLLAVCALGVAISFAADVRRLAAPLAGVVVIGALSIALFHAPAGPTRFTAPVLAAVLAAFMLGATTLGALVIAISRTKVPFAEASAALIVVLELVLPIKAIDETMTRREARLPHATAIWNDVAWGPAPPASIVLVADRGTMRRIESARATGEMRGDLVIVPTFDVQGLEGQHALIAEPKLAPLYRDMALGVPPEELSLAQLGAERPVLATFDPKWDRALSRHMVPVGLTSRFEPEPRGASDRKKALDAFTPLKDHLVRATVAKKDPELAASTAILLRARAIGMAATGERDILSRALDDLRAFAPEDPVGSTLVRRIVTTKGPIDVKDL